MVEYQEPAWLSFAFGHFDAPRQAVDVVLREGQFQTVKVREIIRLIESDGWFLDRTRGSHRQYKPAARGAYGIVEVDPIVGRLLL